MALNLSHPAHLFCVAKFPKLLVAEQFTCSSIVLYDNFYIRIYIYIQIFFINMYIDVCVYIYIDGEDLDALFGIAESILALHSLEHCR